MLYRVFFYIRFIILKIYNEVMGFFRPHPNISLLVPFKTDNAWREDVWKWLRKYWKNQIPGVEIVIGRDTSGHPVFSKTNAVNDAASRATGDVFVILDADCYIPGDVILHCAERIRTARENQIPLWFVPYRTLYRLTKEATIKVLESNPKWPKVFPEPPPHKDIESTIGTGFGHKFGALIMILPKEAFELVNGMDPRFRGWGGEDVSFLRAMDTLFAAHKNTGNDVLHLWHTKVGESWKERMWEGQSGPRANERLASKYNHATGNKENMRKIINHGDD